MFTMPVFSLTINGGISYSVEKARYVAFSNIKYKIDTSLYKNHLIDVNYEKNKDYIARGKFRTKKYILTLYSNNNYPTNHKLIIDSDNAYSITYKSDKNVSFYYDNYGKLEAIGYIIGNSYPRKGLKYYRDGTLWATALIISPKEQFLFDMNKKLIGHWIGDNCYNEQGNLVSTRSRY